MNATHGISLALCSLLVLCSTMEAFAQHRNGPGHGGGGGGGGGGGEGGMTGGTLTTFVTADFSGSGNCAFCHSALTDESGADVSIDTHWRATITQSDQVQIYETITHDVAGQLTYTFLNAAGYSKDNRLLPEGFNKTTVPPDIAVYGAAATDTNFIGGTDTVTYRIAVTTSRKPLTVTAKLLYQPVSFAFAQDLQNQSHPTMQRFAQFYGAQTKIPVAVDSIQQTIE